VLAQDNTEHITAFHSAADHTQTAAKWKEMGIAIGMKNSLDEFASAYDAHVDVIDGAKPETQDKRWKRQGPELTSMYKGDFDFYVQKQVLPRKQEFQEFLRKRLLQQRLRDEESRARAAGETVQVTPEREEELRQDIVENFENELKQLRRDYSMSKQGSELAMAMVEFLDLKLGDPSDSEKKTFAGNVAKSLGAEAASTMPTTHPAAGLSYLRTNDYMPNHPLYGPQTHREPVLARVLLPVHRTGARPGLSRMGGVTLGVGGIVAVDTNVNTMEKGADLDEGDRAYMQTAVMASKIKPDVVGGNKYFVSAQTAIIHPEGHIVMRVEQAPKDAMLVKLGLGDEVRRSKAPQGSVSFNQPPPRSTRTRIRDDFGEDSPILARGRQLGAGSGAGAARFGFAESGERY
jgi:hypothetical protein